MLEGFPLGSYLLLVNYTARLSREGEAAIALEVAAIFERIGTTAETWRANWVTGAIFLEMAPTGLLALVPIGSAVKMK